MALRNSRPKEPQEERQEKNGRKPDHSEQAFTGSGFVNVAVFENEPTGDQKHSTFQISISRTYKDKDDKWQRTHSFFPQDLLPLARLLENAWTLLNNDANKR
ncbi:MAG: hypothetical protein H7831_08385 [Magnetococcus sp. WYHC-3]